jgi:hypothetical protein
MTHKINIAIPKPCNQDWQSMTVVDKSRFCDSCQKNVFDFTKASDREIVMAFNKNNNLCGRFNASQLNRDLILPKEKKPFWTAIAATVIAFLGLGNQEANAQKNVKIEQNQKKIIDNITFLDEKVEVSGSVVDNENNPLSNVSILISRIEIGKSDENGKFSILANNCKLVHFLSNNDDYDDGYYKIDEVNNNVKIICEKYTNVKKSCVVGGVTSIQERTILGKRTFFGRIFHSIGNWFK